MMQVFRVSSSCRTLSSRLSHRFYHAMVCTEYNSPLIYQSKSSIPLQNGQVRIKTRYAGINYADILACKGKYQEKSKPPFTPGLEVSGEISECCNCNRLKVGDRVFCIFTANGAFSEECVVNENQCFLVPSSVPLKAISSLGINYCTASLGLEIAAQMQENEVITITGAAGGTGLAATELSLSRNHPTICIVKGEQQNAFLQDLIQTHYPHSTVTIIDSNKDVLFKDQIKKKYGGSDVVFDTVGTPEIFNNNLLRSVRFGSRLIVVGFSGGTIQNIPANHLLIKNVSAMGIYLGGYLKNRPQVIQSCVQSLCELYETKKLHTHLYKEFSLENANEAMEVMSERKVFGKVILSMNE